MMRGVFLSIFLALGCPIMAFAEVVDLGGTTHVERMQLGKKAKTEIMDQIWQMEGSAKLKAVYMFNHLQKDIDANYNSEFGITNSGIMVLMGYTDPERFSPIALELNKLIKAEKKEQEENQYRVVKRTIVRRYYR
jgi:hypothetical protein